MINPKDSTVRKKEKRKPMGISTWMEGGGTQVPRDHTTAGAHTRAPIPEPIALTPRSTSAPAPRSTPPARTSGAANVKLDFRRPGVGDAGGDTAAESGEEDEDGVVGGAGMRLAEVAVEDESERAADATDSERARWWNAGRWKWCACTSTGVAAPAGSAAASELKEAETPWTKQSSPPRPAPCPSSYSDPAAQTPPTRAAAPSATSGAAPRPPPQPQWTGRQRQLARRS
jgi:hypothetical protein